jgi:hypothetical protein
MPDYRPRRVILKLMTSSMIADELGIPDSTARSLMDRIGWKYGSVHIKGLRRNFIRRRDLESELERVGAIGAAEDSAATVLPKLMTIVMLKKENGLTTKAAYEVLKDVWRLDFGGIAFDLAGGRQVFLRRCDVELRLREIAPYVPARPPGVMARPEIAEELGLPLADTEDLLNYIRKRENPLVRIGRRDYFLRETIARYVEAGEVPERVMLAMGSST